MPEQRTRPVAEVLLKQAQTSVVFSQCNRSEANSWSFMFMKCPIPLAFLSILVMFSSFQFLWVPVSIPVMFPSILLEPPSLYVAGRHSKGIKRDIQNPTTAHRNLASCAPASSPINRGCWRVISCYFPRINKNLSSLTVKMTKDIQRLKALESTRSFWPKSDPPSKVPSHGHVRAASDIDSDSAPHSSQPFGRLSKAGLTALTFPKFGHL